jgi:hypothetical protein
MENFTISLTQLNFFLNCSKNYEISVEARPHHYKISVFEHIILKIFKNIMTYVFENQKINTFTQSNQCHFRVLTIEQNFNFANP